MSWPRFEGSWRGTGVLAADELQDPVGYGGHWVLLAVLALALVAAYYAAVVWWGRPRPDSTAATARTECLARLDGIEAARAAGRISAREGHQQISATVRRFVADASGVPATTMTLADLQRTGPADLAAVIAFVYPPEFAADEHLGDDRFTSAIGRARELVSSWS